MSHIQNKNLKNLAQAGFTLVELMVVVAIIGILATIAIPQYSKFQAKARQSEAKMSLSGIHQTELAYAGESQSFSSCLANIGFAREGGRFYYLVGFSNAVAVESGCGPDGGKFCNSHGWQPDSTTPGAWTDGTTCTAGNGVTRFDANTKTEDTDVPVDADIDDPVASVITQTSFRAHAVGNVYKNLKDRWSINETKLIVNDALGI